MILYACVAAGTEILAEHDPDPDPCSSRPLRPLAAQCLLSAPKFHALYTHTVRGRIYAFLMDSDDQPPQQEACQQQQERMVFFSIAEEALGRANTLLFLLRLRKAYKSIKHPDFPLLVIFTIAQIAPGDEKGSEERGKGSDDGHEREIEVVDCEGSRRKILPAKGRSPAEEAWRRHVRSVVLIDVAICSLMFVVWLTLCRGFQCIA